MNTMQTKRLMLALGLIVALFGILGTIVALLPAVRELGGVKNRLPDIVPSVLSPDAEQSETVAKFGSDEEFRKYLAAARSAQSFGGFGMGRMETMSIAAPSPTGIAMEDSGFKNALGVGGGTDPAVSATNVQVAGIDEPDIVKTDGEYIYFARTPQYRWGEPVPMTMTEGAVSGVESKMIAPEFRAPDQETALIDALPAETIAKVGSIGKSGEMLLFGNSLVVFEPSRRNVAAYDVSDRTDPKPTWTVALEDTGEIVQARNRDGVLYLVERSWVSEAQPCPFTSLTAAGRELSVACTDVYRPDAPSSADAVYTVVAIDPLSGDARDRVSFVGSAGESVVYMSQNAIYVTSPRLSDPIKYILGFFKENGDLLPAGTVEKLGNLAAYDLSPEAKMTEFSQILQRALLGMDGDERLRFENEMENRMTEYAKRHARELERTGIAKVSVPDLDIVAGGSVPGYPLNQFSLDEYDGHLRVATTSGGRGAAGFGWGGRDASVNDVYVLDDDLERKGALLDLGLGERIYSARFVGETGYLVTFRETDPFYVLDLSDPKAPRKAGELKIPGYSSYLHPLGGDLVLGIGKEGANVKLSLFDVSDPDQPTEVSKYVLDEYWSEAVNNHHAFLADPRHETFFLPGGQGGYIFSYDGGTLSLKKAAKDDAIRRALYIGDAFYIVSDTAVYVYDIETWEKVGQLTF